MVFFIKIRGNKMSELATLLGAICESRQREIKAGGALFQQGDPADDIFLVREGMVRLVRYTSDGDAITMFRALPGQTFAEAALFADFYHCSAVADLASRVTCFPTGQLLRGLENKPTVMLELIARLSGQVRELRTLLETRSIKTASERTMHYLHLHADPGTGVFTHAGSLKELAAKLGLAHETFYRTLRYLEKEGKISKTGRTIMLRPAKPHGDRL
jgi:CRP-like cAMP-binding protein